MRKGKTLEAKFLPEDLRRFIQRTRFFTESGIIGSREFVRQGLELFRDITQPKRKYDHTRSRAWIRSIPSSV